MLVLSLRWGWVQENTPPKSRQSLGVHYPRTLPLETRTAGTTDRGVRGKVARRGGAGSGSFCGRQGGPACVHVARATRPGKGAFAAEIRGIRRLDLWRSRGLPTASSSAYNGRHCGERTTNVVCEDGAGGKNPT